MFIANTYMLLHDKILYALHCKRGCLRDEFGEHATTNIALMSRTQSFGS